jgi:hypothetical protein
MTSTLATGNELDAARCILKSPEMCPISILHPPAARRRSELDSGIGVTPFARTGFTDWTDSPCGAFLERRLTAILQFSDFKHG